MSRHTAQCFHTPVSWMSSWNGNSNFQKIIWFKHRLNAESKYRKIEVVKYITVAYWIKVDAFFLTKSRLQKSLSGTNKAFIDFWNNVVYISILIEKYQWLILHLPARTTHRLYVCCCFLSLLIYLCNMCSNKMKFDRL